MAQNTPEERVLAYIKHWHSSWSEVKEKSSGNVDFTLWNSLVSEMTEEHFIPGRSSEENLSYQYFPNHIPGEENIHESSQKKTTAQVITIRKPEGFNAKYYMYKLKVNDDENWLLTNVIELEDAPDAPAIEEDKLKTISAMAAPDAPLKPREDYLQLDENILFEDGREVFIPEEGGKGTRSVNEVGRINLTSGIIGLDDFGFGFEELEPLHRKVEPGEYVVETVSAFGWIGGIRIKFADNEKPVKWTMANTPNRSGHNPVDAGNLAIFDIAHLSELKKVEKEEIYTNWAKEYKPALLTLTHENDCVITPSGYGDGGYPSFWGLNDKDEIVSLYIDFMFLGKEDENGIITST